MNQTPFNSQRVQQILANRSARAFAIAIMMAVIIVVLQVSSLKDQTPMCELLSNCRLRDIDVHRMQIALSKADLSEFKIEGRQLLVPQEHHAEYLQAITDHNAIPDELKSDDRVPAIVNPFLSRSQQLSIDRDNKKRQIQHMVMRLPYVDQAWLEMDEPARRSAFSESVKSAVISIRPSPNKYLEPHHIDTVRQMVSAAISGLTAQQIVVIDLTTGFAHRLGEPSSALNETFRVQQAAFLRQQRLESRIHQALAHYSGLKITVYVEPVEKRSQLAEIDPESWKSSEPADRTETLQASKVAGANGAISIPAAFEDPSEDKATAQAASFVEPVVPGHSEKVTVLIDVPAGLLAELYGVSGNSKRQPNQSTAATEQEMEQQFQTLKADIEHKIRPLIASSHSENDAGSVSINLIHPPVSQQAAWSNQPYLKLAQQNWPSLAALLTGLVMITLLMRTKSASASRGFDPAASAHSDTLTLNNQTVSDPQKQEAESRLSQLIDKDPDAASKVIESWIRDAA